MDVGSVALRSAYMDCTAQGRLLKHMVTLLHTALASVAARFAGQICTATSAMTPLAMKFELDIVVHGGARMQQNQRPP